MNTKTIAAISSGQVPAAIGIIRMSGPESLNIITKCLHKTHLEPRMMTHRRLFSADGEQIDDVMLCYFKAPNSFTGEDMVEVYAHGGPINMGRVLNMLYAAGAVPAEPGDFSRRAFINGRIDLSCAEAIMDVIHAQNETQCREAQRQLSGTVSRTVTELRSTLMNLICAIEASIDFSQEEDLAPLPVERIRLETSAVLDNLVRIRRAHEQYRSGGLRTVLAGRPNAGKSSLFNRLIGHDRAIVTDIAGTTTDTIDAGAAIGGFDCRLIDTAGISATDNPIESIGVERARDQIGNADILIILIDGRTPDAGIFCDLAKNCQDAMERLGREGRLIAARTKADLADRPELPAEVRRWIDQYHLNILDVSSSVPGGTAQIEAEIAEIARRIRAQAEDVTLIASCRHIALIDQAAEALRRSQTALAQNMPAEFVAADIHDAAHALDTITGVIASEDIVNEIFSHFCVGK